LTRLCRRAARDSRRAVTSRRRASAGSSASGRVVGVRAGRRVGEAQGDEAGRDGLPVEAVGRPLQNTAVQDGRADDGGPQTGGEAHVDEGRGDAALVCGECVEGSGQAIRQETGGQLRPRAPGVVAGAGGEMEETAGQGDVGDDFGEVSGTGHGGVVPLLEAIAVGRGKT